jgi:serine/threonine protein kinase
MQRFPSRCTLHFVAVGALQLAAGLRHTHERDVHHMDLRPCNVLWGGTLEDPHLQLADFGLARLRHSRAAPSHQLSEYLDQRMYESPAFFPPEALERALFGGATDCFSFGALLQWLLDSCVDPPCRCFRSECHTDSPAFQLLQTEAASRDAGPQCVPHASPAGAGHVCVHWSRAQVFHSLQRVAHRCRSLRTADRLDAFQVWHACQSIVHLLLLHESAAPPEPARHMEPTLLPPWSAEHEALVQDALTTLLLTESPLSESPVLHSPDSASAPADALAGRSVSASELASADQDTPSDSFEAVLAQLLPFPEPNSFAAHRVRAVLLLLEKGSASCLPALLDPSLSRPLLRSWCWRQTLPPAWQGLNLARIFDECEQGRTRSMQQVAQQLREGRKSLTVHLQLHPLCFLLSQCALRRHAPGSGGCMHGLEGSAGAACDSEAWCAANGSLCVQRLLDVCLFRCMPHLPLWHARQLLSRDWLHAITLAVWAESIAEELGVHEEDVDEPFLPSFMYLPALLFPTPLLRDMPSPIALAARTAEDGGLPQMAVFSKMRTGQTDSGPELNARHCHGLRATMSPCLPAAAAAPVAPAVPVRPLEQMLSTMCAMLRQHRTSPVATTLVLRSLCFLVDHCELFPPLIPTLGALQLSLRAHDPHHIQPALDNVADAIDRRAGETRTEGGSETDCPASFASEWMRRFSECMAGVRGSSMEDAAASGSYARREPPLLLAGPETVLALLFFFTSDQPCRWIQLRGLSILQPAPTVTDMLLCFCRALLAQRWAHPAALFAVLLFLHRWSPLLCDATDDQRSDSRTSSLAALLDAWRVHGEPWWRQCVIAHALQQLPIGMPTPHPAHTSVHTQLQSYRTPAEWPLNQSAQERAAVQRTIHSAARHIARGFDPQLAVDDDRRLLLPLLSQQHFVLLVQLFCREASDEKGEEEEALLSLPSHLHTALGEHAAACSALCETELLAIGRQMMQPQADAEEKLSLEAVYSVTLLLSRCDRASLRAFLPRLYAGLMRGSRWNCEFRSVPSLASLQLLELLQRVDARGLLEQYLQRFSAEDRSTAEEAFQGRRPHCVQWLPHALPWLLRQSLPDTEAARVQATVGSATAAAPPLAMASISPSALRFKHLLLSALAYCGTTLSYTHSSHDTVFAHQLLPVVMECLLTSHLFAALSQAECERLTQSALHGRYELMQLMYARKTHTDDTDSEEDSAADDSAVLPTGAL